MNQGTVRTPLGVRSSYKAVVALSGVVLALAACKSGKAKDAPAPPATVSVGRENISVVAREQLRSGPAVSGTLEAKNNATLRAEISGPVVQTYVERGQSVRRGQLVVRLDDTALREALLSARSAERSAKLSLENAQRDLERNTALEKAGAIAARELENSQRTLAAAQAAYADAQSRLTAAQEQFDKTVIRAPFNGLVSDRPVNAGDVVQPGAALVTVVDPLSMRLEASVAAEQISAVKVGAPVEFAVNGYPSRTFTGRIDRINPTADPATRQVRIYVSIPNEKSTLVAGLFAEGRVTSEVRQGLVVPVSAVDQRGVTPTAMRIKSGKVEKVPVQLGLRDPATERVEVTAGLSAGDTLLLGTAQGITPGTPVRVVTENDQTTAER